MWMERVKSEKEISEKYEEFENGNLDPTHEYSKFILKHYKVYQEKGGSFLWRKYFTNEPIESENSGKRKRVKLESLNSWFNNKLSFSNYVLFDVHTPPKIKPHEAGFLHFEFV